jgi:hypothetical protein
VSEVVDEVVAALNARDVERFVACYSTDATVEDGYDRVGIRGHDDLRARYVPMFEEFPKLRVEPGWRTAVGEFVVQEECVTGRGDDRRHVAVYLVRDGLIVRERLIA